MPSRSQPTEHSTPTDDDFTVPPAPYHVSANYLPQTNGRPDPAWLPYVEANRDDINILKYYGRNDKQTLNRLNQKLGHLKQMFEFLMERYELQQQQLKRRDVVVEQISATLSSLNKMEEITQGNITASNTEIEKANERLTKVEGWFQSLWYKIERMDENDDAYRAAMRSLIDEIEERSRVDRENLEDIHLKVSKNHQEACETKCKYSTLDEGMQELVAKTDNMVLASMREKRHYRFHLGQLERLLADQKSESNALEQKIRHIEEENGTLLAKQKAENNMLKQQMSRLLEEFEEFKAQCMHSPRLSTLVPGGEVSETDWPSERR